MNDIEAPRWVYLHVDADGNALYAGCTVNPRERLRGHMRTAAWAAQIDEVVVVGPYPPKEALGWERELIRDLEPAHNIGSTSRDTRRPPTGARVGWASKWRNIAAQLQERPGEWARCSAYGCTGSASSTAESIRAGRLAAMPAGEFEATARGCDVWVRYIGRAA